MQTGVTAINLEALQMMRRGAPPQGANPFPVPVPLTASTAAAGLAAAAGVQQQQQQGGPAAAGDSSIAAEQPVDSLTATLQDWAITQQQQEQQGAAAVPAAAGGYQGAGYSRAKRPGGAAGPTGWAAAPAGSPGYGFAQPQSYSPAAPCLSPQAQSVYGAAAVVQLQPHGQQQYSGASGVRSSFAASPPVPRVYVERGPARASPSSAAAAASAQKAGASSTSSPQTGRSAGVRRSLHSASSGKSSQGHSGR